MTAKKKKPRTTKLIPKSTGRSRSANAGTAGSIKTRSTPGTGRSIVNNKLLPSKAKVFMTGYSQSVRLPKEYQFEGDEVFITREGDKVILSPKPTSWDHFFEYAPRVTVDFMETREDLPVQERKLFD